MTGLLAHLLVQPLTITNPGSTVLNVYGEAVQVPGVPVAALGYLYQQDSTEYLADRDTTVSHWYCDLFAESVVSPLSTIQFGSQTFAVDGLPQNVWNPRTQIVDHIECKLVVTNG